MNRIVLACAAAAVALLTAATPASAVRQDTCVTWGPTVGSVPEGACIPVQCDGCTNVADYVPS